MFLFPHSLFSLWLLVWNQNNKKSKRRPAREKNCFFCFSCIRLRIVLRLCDCFRLFRSTDRIQRDDAFQRHHDVAIYNFPCIINSYVAFIPFLTYSTWARQRYPAAKKKWCKRKWQKRKKKHEINLRIAWHISQLIHFCSNMSSEQLFPRLVIKYEAQACERRGSIETAGDGEKKIHERWRVSHCRTQWVICAVPNARPARWDKLSLTNSENRIFYSISFYSSLGTHGRHCAIRRPTQINSRILFVTRTTHQENMAASHRKIEGARKKRVCKISLGFGKRQR